MSNSSLVTYTRISPNKTVMNNKKNTHIVIHHMAGKLTVEQCGSVFAPTTRQASSNYGVDGYGHVGLYVDEKDRSWATSSREIDSKAVTIEVADDEVGGNWHVSDIALQTTIDLCVDICKRNGIASLNFTGDKTGNLHAHRWYSSTDCPGDYLYSKFPYIASEVNKRLSPDYTVDGIDYSKVYDYEYYISNNPDVKQIYGTDPAKVFGHFIEYGMKEGRKGNDVFDVNIYKDNYEDLRKAYGNDTPKYYVHYIKWGIGEKRVSSYHIVPVTVRDGIDYSLVYDPKYYWNKYEDLQNAFGDNYDKLLTHFIKWGMVEHRQAKADFNVDVYKSNYHDLQETYGGDIPKYYMHYIKWGAKERRVADREVRKANVEYYIIKDGDSMSDIAEKYETTVDEILILNNKAFAVGQKIRVK